MLLDLSADSESFSLYFKSCRWCRLNHQCCPKWRPCWQECWWLWGFRRTGRRLICSRCSCPPSDRLEIKACAGRLTEPSGRQTNALVVAVDGRNARFSGSSQADIRTERSRAETEQKLWVFDAVLVLILSNRFNNNSFKRSVTAIHQYISVLKLGFVYSSLPFWFTWKHLFDVNGSVSGWTLEVYKKFGHPWITRACPSLQDGSRRT